jgi:Dyp-type peroxidase family
VLNNSEPVLELDDIQGSIAPGFNKDHQTLVFFRFKDEEETRTWLGDIESFIATAREAHAFKRLFEAIRNRRGRESQSLQATWTNVAFSISGLRKLHPEADSITDLPLRAGAAARAPLLGDDPQTWIVGAGSAVPDAVLIIGGDDSNAVDRAVLTMRESMPASFEILHVDGGHAIKGTAGGAQDQFGFRDGISQPGIRGWADRERTTFFNARSDPTLPHRGKPGQDLLWPGEFIFGYHGQASIDPYAPGPVIEGGPWWTRNGSLLVYRRFSQDVAAFRHFTAAAAEQLSRALPDLPPFTADDIAARLVGRRRDGTPLLFEADHGSANNDLNDFGFRSRVPTSRATAQSQGGDWAGLLCPRASHVRRSNPRDDLGASAYAEVQRHRILRRGVTFGDTDGERGLIFLCYQTSIERQFEFIMREWLRATTRESIVIGGDPIVGRRASDGSSEFVMPIRRAGGEIADVTLEIPARWTWTTGGGYFFTPSLSALRAFQRRSR